MLRSAEPPSKREQTHTGEVNRCSICPGPADPTRPEPKWLAELSMQTESHRCPLFGVPLVDPVFGMSGGSCPIRVCSDHANSNGHPDVGFPVATINLAELCESVTSSSLSSVHVGTAPSVSLQRYQKPIPKRSRRAGGRTRNRHAQTPSYKTSLRT
jgi:hypothetical protein